MLNKISVFLKALWLYIGGIIGLLAMYFLLAKIEQGIDVVIQVGERIGPSIWAVLCVLLWSFLAWYSARLVSYAKQMRNNDIPAGLHKHFPRLIAFNCFVCVQTAIVALPAFSHLQMLGLFLFILFHNLLYALLSFNWESNKKSPGISSKILTWILIFGYTGWLVYMIIDKKNYTDYSKRYPYFLSWVSLILFFMELVSIRLFILRRKVIDREAATSPLPEKNSKNIMDRFSLNPKYTGAEAANFKVFNFFAVIAIVIYIIAISSLKWSAQMGPMAFVLLALGVLIGLSNFITYCSIRIRFNVVFILFIWAFILGTFHDPYKVQLLSTGEENVFAKRPDSKTFFHSWLDQRQKLLDKADPGKFEVFIVLSNGGASRSANWVSGVLSRMQDLSYQADTANSFADHLLCMAGASGGTVGNCAFYGLLKSHYDNHNDSLFQHSNNYFAADFLTYTLTRLLGPDLIRHIIPLDIVQDRAEALETVIAQGSKDSLLNGYFSKPLNEVYDYSGRLPVLFINSTRVDDGMPGQVSSIQLPAKSQRIDILQLIDSNGIKYKGGNNLRFSTASILSARFPYVSPAGNILNNYFVDGGYFDNSGAGIILEYMQDMKNILHDTTDALIKKYAGKLHFTLIQIYNGSIKEERERKTMHPLVNDLLTPVLTLEGMQGSSTRVANGILDNFFLEFNADKKSQPIRFNLYDSTIHDEEDYPMSWVISDYNLARMKKRCEEVAKDLPRFK